MNIAAAVLKVGIAVGCAVTAASFAAPFYPPVEMLNHFRPMIVLGCTVLIGLQLLARPAGWWRAIAALSALNAVLLLLPLRLEAARAPSLLGESKRQGIEIVSLNVWANISSLDAVVDYLRASNADIIALQELPKRHADVVFARLKPSYPHQVACGRCRNLAVLSKLPLLEIEEHAVSAGRPGLLVATLANGASRWLLAVVHPSYPFRPFEQARDYAWLTDWAARQRGTLVMAGDFNLTPWAWKMWRLQRATGLVRHGTWALSWSGHLPLQTFLIDNVLTTPDVHAVSFSSGPNVGSDHLPIVVRISLP